MTPSGNAKGLSGVALVTGGAHRLGREIALALGASGQAVAIGYRSDPAKARQTVRDLHRLGAAAAAFRADLSADEGPRRLVADVLGRFGRLDILVHSAAPWITKPLAAVTLSDWDAVFRTGPRAAFFLAQAAADALRTGEGSILLISDVAATKAWPKHVPHAAAKAALNALVVNLAVAMGPEVRVNGLAPGVVLPPEELSQEDVLRLIVRTPLKRKVAVADFVSMAVAVVRNRSMTGQVVAVDAGRSCV
jgi:NAD(P)-dependent dehydrogenase (short-subunit alcohol dehydrogenase family)